MRNKNRTTIIDWILQRDWKLAITLTFKKDCTEHRARKTMRRLWNGIDRQLYHKAFKKQRKRVERVCAFENGQSGTHLHYHIATMPPKDLDISFDKYRLLIDYTPVLCLRQYLCLFHQLLLINVIQYMHT